MCNMNWDELHQLKIACIWHYRFYVKGNKLYPIVCSFILPHFFAGGWAKRIVSINLPSITNLCINTNEIPLFGFHLIVVEELLLDESENRCGVTWNYYNHIYKLSQASHCLQPSKNHFKMVIELKYWSKVSVMALNYYAVWNTFI